MKRIVILLALYCAVSPLLANEAASPFKGMALDTAVWQFCGEVKSRMCDTGTHPKAFLWIPPQAKRLRGVVVGQFNMCERPVLEHPAFRAWLEKIDWGCVWIDTGMFGGHFDHGVPENAAALQEVFDSLAQVTRIEDVKTIPFVGIGHSAMADIGYEMAAWRPDRAVGAISYDGNTLCVSKQNTLYDHPFVTPADLEKMKGVALLHRDSEGNSGRANRRTPLFRTRYPDVPFTILADPSSTHFGTPDETVDFLGSWVVEADKARNPNGKLPLVKIDPKSGWYVDFWRYDEAPKAPYAPVAEFKGVMGPFGMEGNWVFSEDEAKRMQAHVTRQNNKKTTFVAFEQKGMILPYKGDHTGFHPEFIPQKDGLTFHLQGVFTKEFPTNSASAWTKDLPGDDVGRATIKPICGPVVTIDSENMAVRFDRFGINESRRARGYCILATYPGNAEYRRSEIPGVMEIPIHNRSGIPQTISFPELPDVKEGAKEVRLNAVSSVGLPVEYFVDYGPATLKDGVLYLTDIPPCATLPVEVKVTAWQYGTTNEPKVQSAEPVTRAFRVVVSR